MHDDRVVLALDADAIESCISRLLRLCTRIASLGRALVRSCLVCRCRPGKRLLGSDLAAAAGDDVRRGPADGFRDDVRMRRAARLGGQRRRRSNFLLRRRGRRCHRLSGVCAQRPLPGHDAERDVSGYFCIVLRHTGVPCQPHNLFVAELPQYRQRQLVGQPLGEESAQDGRGQARPPIVLNTPAESLCELQPGSARTDELVVCAHLKSGGPGQDRQANETRSNYLHA
mmetsp:Transcript_34733/g.110179  ORF Transcript_34733/g.110179 Transcript_34733/m.110179 type:complete len:228 (+) Transcript_34733:1944-2627(+)